MPVRHDDTSLAVVGMAGRFPGARNVDELWRNLVAGVESISTFTPEDLDAAGVDPATYGDAAYVPSRGILDDVELFDAGFFGYSARDAAIIDPQQRLFLECAWEAIEHAGYDPSRCDGRIGVYAGAGSNTYLLDLLANSRLLATVGLYQALLANDKDHVTMRVAHKLDLRGPAVTIQTTCSTSLVAVHLACQALLSYDADMVLAGGVTIALPQVTGYVHQEDGIFSADGHCRAFDARASGTVPGNGVGIVVLKRLSDAQADGDTIHAVIRGSAINNDGSMKAGYTAPNVTAQAEVVAEALEVAGVDASTVSYIEAHGTGTSLGDPIELTGLAQAFGDASADDRCAIGSMKTNIGHLDTASGVAGLIKAVLALAHGVLPPSLHFEEPNPGALRPYSRFEVNTEAVPWKTNGSPRRAGVSSFGMGGTNAHVVLEEAPAPRPIEPGRPPYILPLSAMSGPALDAASSNLARHLRSGHDGHLSDVAYTLQMGRRPLPRRRVVVCGSTDEAVDALEGRATPSVLEGSADAGEGVAFLFPGQGSQRPGMASALYEHEPAFRDRLDHCAELLQRHLAMDIRPLLFPEETAHDGVAARLRATELAQPALFAVEHALAMMWIDWGITPSAMIGHSVGEYVAACISGVLSLEDALAVIAARGRLVQQLPPGAMLSVGLPEDALEELVGDLMSVAAVNGSDLSVLSGPEEAIATVEADLGKRGVPTQRLHTSHAFHSPMMEPAVGALGEVVAGMKLRPPQIPFISNVSGTWVTDAEATSPAYWARHLRSTVRFGDGVRVLLGGQDRILLEVGPGETLSTLARQHDTASRTTYVASLPVRSHGGVGGEKVASALAQLWASGAPVDWQAYHSGTRRHRVVLPTYPFERARYWIDGAIPVDMASLGHHESGSDGSRAPTRHPRPAIATAHVAPSTELERVLAGIWEEMLGVDGVGIDDPFVDLGGHSLMATQITSRIRDSFGVSVPLDRFFELETISGLAIEVEDLLVAEIEAMSDEEVARLANVDEVTAEDP